MIIMKEGKDLRECLWGFSVSTGSLGKQDVCCMSKNFWRMTECVMYSFYTGFESKIQRGLVWWKAMR